jgi:hypothetical protein
VSEYVYYDLVIDEVYVRANALVTEYREEVDHAGGFAPGVHWDRWSTAKDIYIVGIHEGVRVPPATILAVVDHLN